MLMFKNVVYIIGNISPCYDLSLLRPIMMKETMEETISNEIGNLCFYQSSIKGRVQDFIISFNQPEIEIEKIVTNTLDLVKRLFEKFKDKIIKARLVANVRFINSKDEIYNHHFPSYQMETVWDVEEFFENHMLKIASRLDNFNAKCSNLLIDSVEHIHIALVFLNKATS